MRPRLKHARALPALREAAALLITAFAIVVIIFRLPTAYDDLRGARAAEVGRNDAGGALAAADSVQIDNEFVRAAIAAVGPGKRFAVLTTSLTDAETSYHLDPTTIIAVPVLMLEVLLPAREIAKPEKGAYILCYLCDTTPWDARTQWLWKDARGTAVGLVDR